MGTALALALYALNLAIAAAVVWRRPAFALYLWIVGLAVHNAVMAALYAAGVRGGALTAIQAWKEIVLAVAVGRVVTDAVLERRLPFRRELPDWLALAFGVLVLVYAAIPQSVLGGFAGHRSVLYAMRHDGVPVVAFLLFRQLRIALRPVAWTLLGAAAAVAAVGIVDAYAISIGWWRTNGVVDYFHKQLGYDYHGTGGLPENFVYNTGSEDHFLRRLVSVFLSPLASAYMIVVALVLAAAVLARRRMQLTECYLVAALALIAAAGLLFTFTRAALFALAGALVVLGFTRLTSSNTVFLGKTWPFAAAVATVGVAIAWVHVFPDVAPRGHWTHADLVYQRQLAKQKGGVKGGLSSSEPSIRSHLDNLRDGFTTIAHHPQGYGLGNVGQTAKRFESRIKAGESNYTELGVELGVLGTLLWTLWGLAVLAWLLRARSAGMAAAFAAVLALAIQTDVIGDPWAAYCVWALAGTLCNVAPARRTERAVTLTDRKEQIYAGQEHRRRADERRGRESGDRVST